MKSASEFLLLIGYACEGDCCVWEVWMPFYLFIFLNLLALSVWISFLPPSLCCLWYDSHVLLAGLMMLQRSFHPFGCCFSGFSLPYLHGIPCLPQHCFVLVLSEKLSRPTGLKWLRDKSPTVATLRISQNSFGVPLTEVFLWSRLSTLVFIQSHNVSSVRSAAVYFPEDSSLPCSRLSTFKITDLRSPG